MTNSGGIPLKDRLYVYKERAEIHSISSVPHHFQISEYFLTPVVALKVIISKYSTYCYPVSKGYRPETGTKVPQDLRLVSRKHNA